MRQNSSRANLAPFVDSLSPNQPRVMFWQGKVNQHWDQASKSWQTDPDGRSGAEVDTFEYCKKFYPSTTHVFKYHEEESNHWHDAGNSGGPYVAKMNSYICMTY